MLVAADTLPIVSRDKASARKEGPLPPQKSGSTNPFELLEELVTFHCIAFSTCTTYSTYCTAQAQHSIDHPLRPCLLPHLVYRVLQCQYSTVQYSK